MTKYAELHCHSFYSFLDGAASPEQLVATAAELGLSALAITDHDGLYGAPRLAEAAAECGLPTVFGAELNIGLTSSRSDAPDPPGEHVLVLARNPTGYRSLATALSRAHMRGGTKGLPRYDLAELSALSGGQWQILTGCRKGAVPRALQAGGLSAAEQKLRHLVELFGAEHVAVELVRHGRMGEDHANDSLVELARRLGLATVASNNVHYAVPEQFRLASAVAAIRARRSLAEMDGYLAAAGTAYLRAGHEMRELFARWPGAVERAAEIGADCAFALNLVAPQLPNIPVPAGYTLDSYLSEKVFAGALKRYGTREQNPKAYKQLDHELRVIAELGFAGYFLIVWHIVQFCRQEKIMCQGRGSAANSAVCYTLDITKVDAVDYGLLFERFLSAERRSYPDIDIDIQSDRREEVIQFVYEHYGRERAAMVANVISYRPKLAVRDAARALGYSPGQADAWSKYLHRHQGISADTEIPDAVVDVATQLLKMPRHLGIHPGGMVLADRPVTEVCPVEWGRMPGRTVLQWDKDDCAYAGLIKFDLLGLGMLSALQYAVDLIAENYGKTIDLADLNLEDPAVYEMLCRADSVGLFQVESRAQIQTLPRMRPSTFHDLAIEVALIRPGPIQGGAVNPYLKWRKIYLETGKVPYIHPLLRNALSKTLGVPIFQEQLMQLATDAAGFSPAAADELRRAMGAKRSAERMKKLKKQLYAGMEANGLDKKLANNIWAGLKGFAEFGFPESHAISFAFIVYSSAWLKLYYSAAFYAALLNAQPMGFYSPASLIADARHHGITTLRPDINASRAQACLEKGAIRLGLSSVRSIGQELAEELVEEREKQGPYRSIDDVASRVRLTSAQLENLATADAFADIHSERRGALWQAGNAAQYASPEMLPGLAEAFSTPHLPAMNPIEKTVADTWTTGISTDIHPFAHVRPQLDADVKTIVELAKVDNHTRVHVAGMITHRQRPETANGTTFLNLEDETGMLNVVCTRGFWLRNRTVAHTAIGVKIRGYLEKTEEGAISLTAEYITPLPVPGAGSSRDFR
ncbi:MAG: error-prone DNA polymerase [Corynebacteriales bacterium]|nr:error-prone DNA polymerase [Mycobacteriales bacterium]